MSWRITLAIHQFRQNVVDVTNRGCESRHLLVADPGNAL
jgi:hypothetical protein